MADLCAWFPKVREGGIIGGHDYGRSEFGVTRAVDEFFGRFGWRVHAEGGYVWWIEKEHLVSVLSFPHTTARP